MTLEQVDRMLEESTPRNSSKWRPNTGNMYSVRKNRASVVEAVDPEEDREVDREEKVNTKEKVSSS